jgi:hypothetical protein
MGTGTRLAQTTSMSHSRFDAESVARIATITAMRRFEIELEDPQGKRHVVSLPLSAAVELGCLIHDLAQGAPYLVGGAR